MTLHKLLEPGAKAPDFSLSSSPREKLSLSQFKGRPVILVFYPADWSPVCGDELQIFSELKGEFSKYNAEILAISVDGPWCHQAYKEARKLGITLLSDFEPKGQVSRSYGAYRETDGFCERALFAIDPQGLVQWSYLSPIDQNPGVDGPLEALEKMTSAQSGLARQSSGASDSGNIEGTEVA